MNSYYSGDQSALEEALTADGLTVDDFKKSIKDGLLMDKVKAEIVKDVTSVPDEKVTAYYATNLTSFYVEPSRGLRHILVKPVATGKATTTGSTDGSGAGRRYRFGHRRRLGQGPRDRQRGPAQAGGRRFLGRVGRAVLR